MAKNFNDKIGSRSPNYTGRNDKIIPNFTSIEGFESVADDAYKIFSDLISDLSKEEQKAIKNSAELKKKYEEASVKIAQKEYQSRSVAEKLHYLEQQKNADKLKKAELDRAKEVADRTSKNDAERLKALKDIAKEEAKIQKRSKESQKEIDRLKKISLDAEMVGLTKSQKKRLAQQKELEDRRKAYEDAKAAYDGSAESERNLAKAKKELDSAEYEAELRKSLENLASSMANFVDGMVNSATSVLTEYSGKVSARLQGTGTTFSNIVSTYQGILTGSPYVQIKNVLSKVAQLSEAGIAYNLELRAFLGTISENIASTFDAANGTLLRLIRLQQADSTDARLGMEAVLTRFLNEMYEDTSYLSNVADNVRSSILGASSQLTRDMSQEFEFTVDKWLGSLYSVGASDAFVNSIAQGLNLLGTGDVSALASNEQLQTLFAMAASRAGISYPDILLNGLDAKTTNDLLKSIVEYLGEIAQGTNQVVKSAYGGVFGFNLSDLRAIQNLTTTDIQNISTTNLTYKQAQQELQNQLGEVPGRLTMAALLGNVLENVKWTAGSEIASNPLLFAAYQAATMLESAGGIPIPEISVAGFGIGNLGTIAQWLKLGTAGISLLPTFFNLVSSLSNGLGTDLSAYGYKEYTSRGEGFSGSSSLQVRRTSGQSTSYVATSSTDDIRSTTAQQAMGESGAPEEITSGEYKNYRSVEDLFKALIDPFGGDYISVGDTILHSALRVNGNTSGGSSLEVFDPSTSLLAGALNSEQNAVQVSSLDSEKNSVRYDEISVNTANTVIVLTAILSLLADITGTSNPLTNLPTSSKTQISSAMDILTGKEQGDMTSAVSSLAQLISDGVRSGIVDASLGNIFNNNNLPT